MQGIETIKQSKVKVNPFVVKDGKIVEITHKTAYGAQDKVKHERRS